MTVTTWNANATNSWRLPGTFATGWRNDGLAYHGGQSNLHKGLWFFNDANIRSTLAGERILKVELTITRQNSSHGTTGMGYPVFRTHNHSSQPTGEPTVASNFTGSVGFNRGDRKTQELPVSWGENLRDGTARGLALYTTNGAAYLVFLGNATLRITHESINNPPLSPTINSPSSGTTWRTDENLPFNWNFRDPDSGDSQGRYELQVRRGTTVVVNRAVNTSATNWDMPADTLISGSHDWRVRTRDVGGLFGPWSSYVPFSMIDPVTDAPEMPALNVTANQVINTNEFLLEWTVSTQKAAEFRRVADNNGSPNTGTVYASASFGAAPRSHLITFSVNNRYEHLQMRVQDPETDFWSAWRSVRIEVSFTPPKAPVITDIIPVSQLAGIEVSWSIPPASAGEPETVGVDIRRRRVVKDQGSGLVVIRNFPADEVTYMDPTPASITNYEYAVIARADNGTTAWSEWTS